MQCDDCVPKELVNIAVGGLLQMNISETNIAFTAWITNYGGMNL